MNRIPQRAIAAVERPPPAAHPASGDCERLRDRGLAQPANSLSSLAYAAAGAWILRRRGVAADPTGAAVHGLVLLANGVGGVGFHGRGDRASRWLHDVALVGVLALVATGGLVRHTGARLAATGAVTAAAGVVIGRYPDITRTLGAVAGIAAAAGEAATIRRDGVLVAGEAARAVAATALATGTAVNLLSRTGARWCRPDSWLQGHAAWHVLTAVALAAWGEHAFIRAR